MLRHRLLLTLTSFLAACANFSPQSADHVFLNGGIYTVDDQRTWQEAVAVRDGEIVYVGSNDDARLYIGEITEVTDLSGKMLLPGFHDAHAHILEGGASINECDLGDSSDIDRIRKLLEECRENRDYGADQWVVGSRWPLAAFGAEGPTRHILDEVFAGRPAVFIDSFGHNLWASTRALELAGINAHTEDPEGGIIVRDPLSGEPTGTLRASAMDLVNKFVPAPSLEQMQVNLSTGLREANRFGITAFIEPGVSERYLQVYHHADRRGLLSARVLASLAPRGSSATAFDDAILALVEKRHAFNGKYLKTNSVKVFMDGVIETHTSNLIEPYTYGESNFDTFYSQEQANQYYQKLDAMGIQIHTHAIGDGAVQTALNAYEYALEKNGPNDNRHHITHLQLVDESDIPRFGQLDVAANFQALWAHPDQYYELAKPLVGQRRADSFYPIKSILDSGGTIVGGSDWFVSSLNPLDAIEVAVRRQDPQSSGGSIHNPQERVSLETMLDAYTRNASWIMHLEHETGTVEVGKRADFVVLDRNLFEISVADINSAIVLLTMLDGRVVYSVFPN